MAPGAIVRAIPNLITCCRLAAMPVLVALAWDRRAGAFAWLLLVGLLSDIADGLIARALHIESPFGAALDTAAYFLLVVCAAIGMVQLQPAFVEGHAWQLLLLAALYVGEVIASFARYGRLSSFHLYTTRIWAYAQGIFFVALFFWGEWPWLFYVAWAAGIVSHLEEFTLLALFPEWRCDVRGLYWVLAQRAGARATPPEQG